MAIASHLQRVSAYCALLGERLGVDPDLICASRAGCTTSGWPAVSDAVTASPAR